MMSGSVASSLASPRTPPSARGPAATSAEQIVLAAKGDLRKASQQLVAAALVEPALASMREGSTAVEPFAPTTAEKRFGPMLDSMLADRIVGASNFELPKMIERQLTARMAAKRGVTA
jgi:hypothetical protein